jgi:hypothetical protein
MSRVKWGVVAMMGALALAGTGVIAAQFAPAPQETQPIPFYHVVHAGTNKIPCMYCHYTADRSVDAGIPSVQVCAGCHIPGGVPMVAKDSAGVKLLVAYWQRKQPIPWVRVYRLPSYVHFPHMMHINAGLRCQQCHGPVQTVQQVTQVASLRMGWCVSCHRRLQVRTDCEVCHH